VALVSLYIVKAAKPLSIRRLAFQCCDCWFGEKDMWPIKLVPLICDNWWKKSEGNWLTLVNVEMATEMEEFEGTPTPVPCPTAPSSI